MRVSRMMAIAAAAAMAWSTAASAQTFTSTPNLATIDNATVSDSIDTAGVGTIQDLNVCVDITHTWDSDLDLFLDGPGGTVELSTDNGGSGDNYTSTIFDDSAANSVVGSAAPFTGSFRPETPLSALNGTSGDGTWTLRVGDDASGDGGTLNLWGLAFNGSAIDCVFTPPPPEPPQTVADLGTYDPNGPPQKYLGNLGAPNGVDWVSFTIANDGTRVEINSAKTLTIPFETRLDDSEIGLYGSDGVLIANNDDINFPSNPYSKVTAVLDAGTYYVALGEFNTLFNAGFNVTSNGTDGGEYWINIIPEPGTALLLGLGVVGLIRRRR